jgi:hypothetical protein
MVISSRMSKTNQFKESWVANAPSTTKILFWIQKNHHPLCNKPRHKV